MRPICRFTIAGSRRFFERGDADRQAVECQFDALAELVMDGALFVAPIGRSTQDHRLTRRGASELYLDAFLDRAPFVGLGKCSGECLRFRFRGAAMM